jgi:predicted signal transduction protein with EAL and GGDEF domain
MLQPNQFIPLAEETGLVAPIGRWVLKTACEQHMAWQRDGLPPICMAINLSPRQFQHEHLLRDIDDTLSTTGMSPELLELEITEGMVMQNAERIRREDPGSASAADRGFAKSSTSGLKCLLAYEIAQLVGRIHAGPLAIVRA